MSTTEEELARLDTDQVPPERLIWTSYSFSHFDSTHSQRHAFRTALTDAGFTAPGMDTEGTDDRYWHHWSHTIRPAVRDGLREADTVAAELSVRSRE